MEQFKDNAYVPENEPFTSDREADITENQERRKKVKKIAKRSILAAGIVAPRLLGYVDIERDASGTLYPVITPEGERAFAYMVDKVETAADVVTGTHRTENENGESIEYIISDSIDTMNNTIDKITESMGVEPIASYGTAEDSLDEWDGGVNYQSADGATGTPES